jgi:hypothetical protein
VTPIDPNVSTENNVFKDPDAYKMALAKIYSTYAINGQQGDGGGKPDIEGIDENFGNYLRQYWVHQELPTDEAIMAWDDATIKNFHWHTWAPNDVFVSAMYNRIFLTITISNGFIRATEAGIGSASGSFKADLEYFQAEARFLRALSYWHAIDMFGNVPFVTEKDKPGSFFPQRITRDKLFDYIVAELIDIESKLMEPKANEYGRADRAAAWMLLSKMYLNAKVYKGVDMNTEAITYLKKVIEESGYTIDPNYKRMFSADNHTSPEIIFPICFDGTNTQQYGGMTFLLHASNGGGMPLYGIDGGWGGIRTMADFVGKFGIVANDTVQSVNGKQFSQAADKRAMFFYDSKNWKWEVDNVGTFTHGVGVTKFRNVTVDGQAAPNAHPTFVSTDFPMFRLSDAYLMYAEAVLRQGQGGSLETAKNYINELRDRAFGDVNHRINVSDITFDFILDERARELYWECHRRTDLIRFGKFTGGSYLWTWKGNQKTGVATSAHRDLYPIPASDLQANPNLIQNDGYIQ